MDVIVQDSPWHPANLMNYLNPGDRLIAPAFEAQDGKRAIVLIDGSLDTIGKDGLTFHGSVCLRANKAMNGGVLQIRSNNVSVNCEIDGAGLACQGIQVMQWQGKPSFPPNAVRFDEAYVHDIAPAPAGSSDHNGLNHAFYLQNSRDCRGSNVRIANVPWGAGIQCYPDSADSLFTNVDMLECYQGAFFWGATTKGNQLTFVYCPLATPNRGMYYSGEYPSVQGGGASGNVFDYEQQPTDGYGYQGGSTPPPSDLEARVTALEEGFARLRDWIAAGESV